MDRRAVKPGTEAPIKITLCLKGKTTTTPTGIKLMPEQWDPETRQVVRHPHMLMLNTVLAGRKNDIDMTLLRLIEDGTAKRARTVTELKDMIMDAQRPDSDRAEDCGEFYSRFVSFGESRRTEDSRFTVIDYVLYGKH